MLVPAHKRLSASTPPSAWRDSKHVRHVAALLLNQAERVNLERALSRIARLTFVTRALGLEQVVESGTVSCVVTELEDSERERLGTTIGIIRGRFPLLPIVLHVPLEPQSIHSLTAIPELPTLQVAVRLIDNVVDVVTSALRTVPPHPAAQAISKILNRHASPRLRPVCTFLCGAATRPLRVTDVCREMRIANRTMNDWLKRATLPPMELLVGWVRVLHALWKLDARQSTVDYVAHELHFQSASALRHMVKRYTGMAASEIFAAGGFRYALVLFESALTNGAVMREEQLGLHVNGMIGRA